MSDERERLGDEHGRPLYPLGRWDAGEPPAVVSVPSPEPDPAIAIQLQRNAATMAGLLARAERAEAALAVRDTERDAETRVTEYAQRLTGGGFQVWPTDPAVLDVYPLALRIEHTQRFGGTVYTRRVAVIEDWSPVRAVVGEPTPTTKKETP